jgi:hypothetical protein
MNGFCDLGKKFAQGVHIRFVIPDSPAAAEVLQEAGQRLGKSKNGLVAQLAERSPEK